MQVMEVHVLAGCVEVSLDSGLASDFLVGILSVSSWMAFGDSWSVSENFVAAAETGSTEYSAVALFSSLPFLRLDSVGTLAGSERCQFRSHAPGYMGAYVMDLAVVAKPLTGRADTSVTELQERSA